MVQQGRQCSGSVTAATDTNPEDKAILSRVHDHWLSAIVIEGVRGWQEMFPITGRSSSLTSQDPPRNSFFSCRHIISMTRSPSRLQLDICPSKQVYRLFLPLAYDYLVLGLLLVNQDRHQIKKIKKKIKKEPLSRLIASCIDRVQ